MKVHLGVKRTRVLPSVASFAPSSLSSSPDPFLLTRQTLFCLAWCEQNVATEPVLFCQPDTVSSRFLLVCFGSTPPDPGSCLSRPFAVFPAAIDNVFQVSATPLGIIWLLEQQQIHIWKRPVSRSDR